MDPILLPILSLVFHGGETDGFLPLLGLGHEPLESFEDELDLIVMGAHCGLQLKELPGEHLMSVQHVPDASEGPHDSDVDLDGLRTVQDARQHGNPVLGKGADTLGVLQGIGLPGGCHGL